MREVVIVIEHSFGSMQGGESAYRDQIDSIKMVLRDEGVKVTIAKTFRGAKRILKDRKPVALVFISRGMVSAAQEARRNHSNLRVVIFTGLVPRGGEIPDTEGIIWGDKLRTLRRQEGILRTILAR